MDLKSKVRTIPNYPHDGIMFRDITTLFKDPEGFKGAMDALVERYKNMEFDYVVGIEARGFILGAAVAYALGKGFIPIRKKGKLPGKTISQTYDLEYGTDEIEIHEDALEPGSKVILLDDLLATGGTALGAVSLIKKLGAEVLEAGFIVDLPDLPGGRMLKEHSIKTFCLMEFEGE